MKKKPDLDLTAASLGRTPVLRDLVARAEHHQKAERVVLSRLPESLTGGVRFVSCREGELVLSAQTGAIASQLRFRQHEIMASLREEALFRFVWKLRVKVVPARVKEQARIYRPPLSNENARLLREEAGHTKDKQLREVLEKLASHVRD